MSTVKFRGTEAALVQLEKMAPAEVDAVERVTGLTFRKIQFKSKSCACDHSLDAHMHRDDDGELDTTKSDCTQDGCGCDEFEPDLPTIVDTALAWVALKRANPTLSFSEVNAAPLDEFEFTAGGDVDPTGPPPEAA